VRRVLALLLLGVTLFACGSSGSTNDPYNAVAEVGHKIDRGYDNGNWDPDAAAAATAMANRIAAAGTPCDNFAVAGWESVLTDHQRVQLPMPGASGSCTSTDDEDITIEAFTTEKKKDEFIEAKSELICARGIKVGTDPETGETGFDGLIYVDLGTIIVEPDFTGTRDALARELDGTPSNMCAGTTDSTAVVPSF
jgi:hypothetical protein